MNMFKNLFAALIMVGSLAMIACQGDTKDARDIANETPATTVADPNAMQTSTTAPGDAAQQAANAAAAENQVPTGPTTTVVYEHTDFDFGDVKEGEKVKHTFKFKNTGSEPLIISNAKGSCGCTVPKWPSEPIAPGASSQIEVEFDSKGKPGKQTKRVTVTANTVPAQMFLNISGNVEKDPNAPAPVAATPVPPKQ
jgi:hypothetical protein